ncbi:MAG TPA: hypothetical protein VMG60_02295 [Burkholderiaceae bacterium]|nr:hypothetical protein [Burkholderiaceae bacterium]
MKGRIWLALACLVAGIPLAAYGLAEHVPLLAVVGLALVFAFWFFAWQWIARANKPATPIKPAANAAWNMRDQPAATPERDERADR